MSVPCADRVPPLTLRLTTKWRRLRSAALLSDGRRRFAHKYEELLDVALDAPAQLGLGCRAVIQEGTADGQQALFPGLLCGAPLLFLGMGEGFGLSVEPVDGFGPLGQLAVIGVEALQVVDVPQQVGPAPLFGAVVMVVGGVEIADQHPREPVAEDFIHHRLASATPQEVAVGGRAERPHIAVGAVLPPAGLIGVDHGAAADALHDARHRGP